MTDKEIQVLVKRCLQALKSLGAEKETDKESDVYKVYRELRSMDENICSGCGGIMFVQNCCLTDLKENKMYHVGCAPPKPVKKKKIEKGMDLSEKLDIIIDLLKKDLNKND